MNLKKWLKQWGLDSLKINASIVEAEWSPKAGDKEAAWKLYIELLTRITTQALPTESGDEKTALESIYSLFKTTRKVLKEQGQNCIEFTKIAIVVLNQVVRPFTAKWHPKSIADAFECQSECAVFREDLISLQVELRKYSRALADLAGVEDLTNLEDVE
jgi:hypothetical protein